MTYDFSLDFGDITALMSSRSRECLYVVLSSHCSYSDAMTYNVSLDLEDITASFY